VGEITNFTGGGGMEIGTVNVLAFEITECDFWTENESEYIVE